MPYIVSIPLKTDERPRPDVHRSLHANVYAWFAAADPDLAEELHSRTPRKPFTLSPLMKEDGNWAFRVALLKDELWQPFQEGLAARPIASLRRNEIPLAMVDVALHHRTYREMFEEAGTSTRIDLKFLTMTCFKAGDLYSPLPEPRSIIRSWLTRWSEYAPPDLRINVALVDVAMAHLGVSAYNLRTRVQNLGYGQEMGFLGWANLRVVKARKLGPDLLRQFNALADYAEFCGTGRKTTHGMGQTRRRRERREKR
jgi:CRISPR-associated endoribonuclease Cas6